MKFSKRLPVRERFRISGSVFADTRKEIDRERGRISAEALTFIENIFAGFTDFDWAAIVELPFYVSQALCFIRFG